MTGDDLRRLAMALPEVEERLTWEVDIGYYRRNSFLPFVFTLALEPRSGGRPIRPPATVSTARRLDLETSFDTLSWCEKRYPTSVNAFFG